MQRDEIPPGNPDSELVEPDIVGLASPMNFSSLEYYEFCITDTVPNRPEYREASNF